jgi:hypothetical protein
MTDRDPIDRAMQEHHSRVARGKLRDVLTRHEHDWETAFKAQDKKRLTELVERLGRDISELRDSNISLFSTEEQKKLSEAIYLFEGWAAKNPWSEIHRQWNAAICRVECAART